MNLAATVIIGLASMYLVTAWTDGSLFENVRGWLEQGMLAERFRRLGGSPAEKIGEKLTDLLLCPLCLSPYMCLLGWTLVTVSVPEVSPTGFVSFFCGVFSSAAISWAGYKTFTLQT